jgi:hypothetical protein
MPEEDKEELVKEYAWERMDWGWEEAEWPLDSLSNDSLERQTKLNF